MNYLQLVEKARVETGISGSMLTTLTGLRLELSRLAGWVADAWEEIQLLHSDWKFMQGSFAFETVARYFRYNAVRDALLEDFRDWELDTFRIYKKDQGVLTEQPLVYTYWDDWRALYGLGATIPANPDLYTYTLGQVVSQAQSPTLVIASYADWVDSYCVNDSRIGRPSVFSVRPDRDIVLAQAPDSVYVVGGNYRRDVVRLVNDTDVPTLPERYHRAIVALAKRRYGEYMNAPEAFSSGDREYNRVLSVMENDERPPLTLSGFGD